MYIGKKNILIEKLKYYANDMDIEICGQLWEGLTLSKNGMYSLIIINICDCPEWSLGVIRFRRESNLPIAVLSDRYRLNEKTEAFRIGADDYITGINDIIELSARLTKGNHICSAVSDIYSGEKFTVDVRKEKVYKNGEYIRLTPIEFDLFYLLFSHRGNVVSHNQIRSVLTEKGYRLKETELIQCISKIRRKLGDDRESPKYVHTVIGEGYMLTEKDIFFCV